MVLMVEEVETILDQSKWRNFGTGIDPTPTKAKVGLGRRKKNMY
jgi:hypothetical protein